MFGSSPCPPSMRDPDEGSLSGFLVGVLSRVPMVLWAFGTVVPKLGPC